MYYISTVYVLRVYAYNGQLFYKVKPYIKILNFNIESKVWYECKAFFRFTKKNELFFVTILCNPLYGRKTVKNIYALTIN